MEYNFKNVINLGIVSFFMQLGATLVFSTGNIIIANTLMPVSTLILVRSMAESIPILLKLFSGTLSDIFDNKKTLLFLGYGGIIVCKIAMLFSTFTEYFSISLLAAVYITALFVDRFLNTIRDIPRDTLIINSSNSKDLHIAFGLRKIIGSSGSIIGGILSFILVYMSLSGKIIYTIAIIPLIIANIILYKMVKNISVPSNISINRSNTYKIIIYIIFGNIINFFLPIVSIPLSSHYLFEKFSFVKFALWNLVGGIFYYIFYLLFSSTTIAGFATFNFMFFLNRLVASELFVQVKENIKNKEFMHIGILSILLSLGRINDTIYFTYGVQIGFDVKMTVLFFTFYYISMIIGSMIFTKLAKRISLFKYLVLVITSLMMSNLLIAFSISKISFMMSLFFVALFSAGTELILQLLVAKSFTIARGTMFGYFYTLNGLFTILNAIFVHKLLVYNGIAFAAKCSCIFPLILMLYLFIFKRREF